MSAMAVSTNATVHGSGGGPRFKEKLQVPAASFDLGSAARLKIGRFAAESGHQKSLFAPRKNAADTGHGVE
jgi:hypothetical protein